MKKNRRSFLQLTGKLAAGGLLLPHIACNGGDSQQETSSTSPSTDTPMKKADIEKFGIQLYTLRDVMPQDPKGVLRQLSEFGYKQIESYEGDLGIFWGMPHKDYKKYCDDLGIRTVSSHCEIKDNFEEKAAQAAEVGLEYLICPWIGPQKSMEDWKKVTDQFNACGEICKKNGIRFAYHNHAYSFKAFTGQIPHDFIMKNTDPDLVDHEMDIYWVVTGGADPMDYLTRYPNRFRLCHIKDRMKDAGDEEKASCNLGTGIIDYPKILKVAKEQGMKYFIVEQERYDNGSPLKSAQVNAEYMKSFQFA